MGYEVR